jgi:hypothetical protein
MFAVKSMDVNSNLLKLKLDMVYHDLPMEEAQKKFADLTATTQSLPPPEEAPAVTKPKKKTIKTIRVNK